jgi:hypothetical protein
MVDGATTEPAHGRTKLGQAVQAHTLDHMPTHSGYARFNKWLAIKVTKAVGSMTCAYVFSVIALISLPAILSAFKVFHNTFPNWLVKASLIALISWIAQTYLQLVLLSVIIVGQTVQADAADARAAKTFEDTEVVVDRLDEHTAGGIKIILDRLDQIEARLPHA